MSTSVPVQLVEKTKEYDFKPYVQNNLSPYQIYFLIDKECGAVYKLSSISYTTEFILTPLLTSKSCSKIVNKDGIVKELLKDYEIYTVPSCCASHEDRKSWQSQSEAELDLVKWIYNEVIPNRLYREEHHERNK